MIERMGGGREESVRHHVQSPRLNEVNVCKVIKTFHSSNQLDRLLLAMVEVDVLIPLRKSVGNEQQCYGYIHLCKKNTQYQDNSLRLLPLMVSQ